MNDFWLDIFYEYDMIDKKKSESALLLSGFVSVLRHKQYYFYKAVQEMRENNGNDQN